MTQQPTALFIWDETPQPQQQCYIGSRISPQDMDIIMPGLKHLNKKCARSISAAVKSLYGLPHKRNDSAITYYSVTPEQYEQLTYTGADTMIALKHSLYWRPLVRISESDLNATLDRVNNYHKEQQGTDRPQYNNQQYKLYQQQLAQELTHHIFALNINE
jgi:hypothetical protein